MVKYDASGNVLWARSVQGGRQALVNITTDASGNLYLLGGLYNSSAMAGAITLNNPSPKWQYFIVKYDPSGNVLWAKTEGEMQGMGAGTAISTILGPGGLECDASGNLFITTNFRSPSITVGSFTLTNTDPSGSTDDILVAKYAPSGNVVWAKSYGGSKNDDAYGIAVTPSGDVYIDGTFNSPTLTFGSSTINNTASATYLDNAFVARLNGSGNPVWAAASGGTVTENAVGIESDAAGNVYMTGGFRGSTISFPGTTITNPKPAMAALYLVKLNSSNTADWSKVISSATAHDSDFYSGTWGYSIAMSACGVIWVSGVMYTPVTIDGNILDTPVHPTDPFFIAGYTTSGTYVGSAALQSGGDDQNGIACDPAGNVYMCSDYQTYGNGIQNNDYFKVGTDILSTTSSGGELLFIAKYPTQNAGASFTHRGSTLCYKDGVVLTATQDHRTYVWNDGTQGPKYTVKDTGVIWVYGIDSCASYADTFRITNCGCENTIFVPNTFTPNGDNVNDVFYPYSASSTELIKSFRIYDRWGELLFERNNITANDISNAWDGSYKGASPHTEAFVWVIDAVCENGTINHLKGSVTIVR